MTAKITGNPNFGTPLRASCLALESAEHEHTESLDLSCSLGPTSEKAGRVLGLCRWHVLRTVEFASEFLGVVFRRKPGLALPKLFCRKFRRRIPPQISPANFAGKFHQQISPASFARQVSPGKFRQQISPANFTRQISPVKYFAKRPPQIVIRLSSLLSSFGLLCLTHKRMPLGMVCGGTRHEALWEGGWGRTLPWTSESDCHKTKLSLL